MYVGLCAGHGDSVHFLPSNWKVQSLEGLCTTFMTRSFQKKAVL